MIVIVTHVGQPETPITRDMEGEFQAHHKFFCDSTEKSVLLLKTLEWRKRVMDIMKEVDPSLRGRYKCDGFLVATDDAKIYQQLLERGFEAFRDSIPDISRKAEKTIESPFEFGRSSSEW